MLALSESCNSFKCTLSSFFEVQLCHLYVSFLSSGPNHVIIGLLVGFNAHNLHLSQHLRNERQLLLMAQKINEKVKVLQSVLSLVKESFKVSINSFVDLSMMELLISS